MTETLFGNAVPAGVDFSDGGGIALGTVFRSDVDGTVTHSRFFRSTTAPATVVGGLFTLAGGELARVTHAGPAAGWNQAAFAAPVPIVAGMHYIAAYYSSSSYVATSGHFTADRPNGSHLTATRDGATGANGRYAFPATDLVVPLSDGNGTCYFADIVFEPLAAGSVDGAAAFSAAGTLAGGGRVVMGGAGLLSAVATLTGTGRVAMRGAAALVASASARLAVGYSPTVRRSAAGAARRTMAATSRRGAS